MEDSPNRWSLPFAAGVAAQRYLSAEQGLVDAHREGCSHWYIDASVAGDMPDDWDEHRRTELVAAAAELGLSPIIHGNFRAPLATEIPELQEATLAYLRREIDLAARLKATSLMIHGGAHVEPRPTKAHRDQAMERFLRLLAIVVKEAAARGVEIWLENLSYYPKYRPFSYVFTREADFGTALAAIPELRFILDIGHANVNQSAALPMLSAHARSIAALSLSNNSGDQDAHLALDQGTVPITDVIACIREAHWRGVLAFETRNATIPDGLDYLRRLWETGAAAEGGGAVGRVPQLIAV